MGKIVVTEWMSLDGVFDAKAMSVWFNPYHSDGRAAAITALITSSSALLLGRVTYEMLAPYWSGQTTDEMGPASKLNGMPKYVVSSTLKQARWANTAGFISGDVEGEVARLRHQVDGDILIAGSAMLTHSLIAAGLVDEFVFLVHPIIMGSGARFFAEEAQTTELELVAADVVGRGVTLLRYQPATG